MTPDEELSKLLDSGAAATQVHYNETKPEPPPPVAYRQDLDLCQWQVSPNGIFRPAARTIASVLPGAYSTGADDNGIYLRQMSLMSDDIVELPESANIQVLGGIRKFWMVKERYVRHGLVFKRGILLWGPPGSGKTVTIHLLARDLIRSGGIVLFCQDPRLMLSMLAAVRRIETERPLIVVLEDIDEILSTFGEHSVLSMLDGENQTDNVCYVATTNYPGRLGARIVNRPSRFDERVHVGMPSLMAREAYLISAARSNTGLAAETLTAWAHETEGLSIAHLRELVAAVVCLDQPFGDVLRRLRTMNERPREVDGYQQRQLGFNTAAQGFSGFSHLGR